MLETRVAAVQATPVFLDRDATIAKACDLIAEAGAGGAQLVVFPEAFVPAYPDWVWRRRPWDDGEADWYGRLFDNAVEIPGPDVDALAEVARAHRCHVTIGVNERSGGTLYNTLLFLSGDGELLSRHRKLMPTGGERLVWGTGDGSTLTVHDTAIGRLGGLICWENYMPLARAALYAQGIEIYVAPTWDNSEEWVPTLRHIAKEGGCHVIGVTPLLRGSDVPDSIPGRDDIYGGDEDWLCGATPRSSVPVVRSWPDPSPAKKASSMPTSTSGPSGRAGACSTPPATTRAPTSSASSSTVAPRPQCPMPTTLHLVEAPGSMRTCAWVSCRRRPERRRGVFLECAHPAGDRAGRIRGRGSGAPRTRHVAPRNASCRML